MRRYVLRGLGGTWWKSDDGLWKSGARLRGADVADDRILCLSTLSDLWFLMQRFFYIAADFILSYRSSDSSENIKRKLCQVCHYYT